MAKASWPLVAPMTGEVQRLAQHDAEKACRGLVDTGFRKSMPRARPEGSCLNNNKKVERDDDSKLEISRSMGRREVAPPRPRRPRCRGRARVGGRRRPGPCKAAGAPGLPRDRNA